MEPEKTKNIRLTGLDGLRGFAILLVFLTHINAEPILEKLPAFIRPLGETFFSSGVTAVSILFIFCGFLMAYLYQQPASVSSFLQIRLNPNLSPFIRIGIVFGFAILYPILCVPLIKSLSHKSVTPCI